MAWHERHQQETSAPRAEILLVAAGAGKTPLRAQALDLAPSRDVVLLHRFRERALQAEEYRLRTRAGVEVIALPGHRRAARSWLGDLVGTVDDVTAVHPLVPDLAEREAVVTGPAAWCALVRRCLVTAGLAPELVVEPERRGQGRPVVA